VQLSRLANVEVITGTHLGVQEVLEYGADLVVVATGSQWIGTESHWHYGPLRELALSRMCVLTPEEILVKGHTPEGRRVVIWDGDGSSLGVGLAEHIAALGFEVVIATTFDRVAPMLDATFEGPDVRRQLHELGIQATTGVALLRTDGESLVFQDELCKEVRIDTDTLVLVLQRVSDDQLYSGLAADRERLRDAGIRGLFQIGDCVAPRELGFVITDAHRLAREIDGPSPHIPVAPLVEDDSDLDAVRTKIGSPAPVSG
jgi:dimethylamine/trimethylamine dehydrogenase